jgi:hypothetical protein
MIIYDALLHLIINSIYLFIKSFRVLFNRFLVFNQTQHQRMLYAQLSSLQKLKIKYAAIFNKNLDRFEFRISFSMIFWWKSSIIIIVNSTEIAIVTHDQIMKECFHLIIFTNDIDIDNQIETFAITIIFSTSNMLFIMMNKKQTYLKSIIEITIYSEEIIKFDFVLNVAENHFKNRLIVIFSNCQIAIRVIQSLKKQFDQYLLQILIRKMKHCDREIHILWIFAHVEISNNETINIIVKKIIEWRQSNRESLIFSLSIRRYSSQRSKMKFAFARKLNELRFEESSSLKKSFIESSRSSSRMFSKNSKKWRDSKARSSFKLEQIKSNWEIIFTK